MVLKMMSTVFTIMVIFALVKQTSTGPVVSISFYWPCMALCTAGAGAFAGIMTAGVATGAGIVYGAAACATTCSAGSSILMLLPTL
jgi:hypothetical protein